MITAEQQAARRKYIGASEAAAVLGLDPYRTPRMVWAAKVEGVERPAGKAALLGQCLEPGILDYFAIESGLVFDRHIMRVHANGIMAANYDGIGDAYVVEAKWRKSQERYDDGELYGRASGLARHAGHDAIPGCVLIQVHHQMAVAGDAYQTAYVVALRGSDGIGIYRIKRDEELCERITSTLVAWWQRYVLTKVKPPLMERDNGSDDDIDI